MKLQYILHPIKAIKRTYAWSDYCYRSQGNDECIADPDYVCTRECGKDCEYYSLWKPY